MHLAPPRLPENQRPCFQTHAMTCSSLPTAPPLLLLLSSHHVSPADSSPPAVLDASLVFGGVGPTAVSAARTERHLIGRAWTQETLQTALSVLREEIKVPENAPGGMAQFRMSLVSSFFFKFFLQVANATASESLNPRQAASLRAGDYTAGTADPSDDLTDTAVACKRPSSDTTSSSDSNMDCRQPSSMPSTADAHSNGSSPSSRPLFGSESDNGRWLSARHLSAVGCPERPFPLGVQTWQRKEGQGVVGQPVVHLSADLQVMTEVMG